MRKNTCSTCHWQENNFCHLNPPSTQLVMSQGFQGPQPQPISFHPPVQPSGFCAQWSTGSASDIIDIG